MLQMSSEGMTRSCIPETNDVILGRARKGQSIWGKGERGYPVGVTFPRRSDWFTSTCVPEAEKSLLPSRDHN
jgi:hypothetical protein